MLHCLTLILVFTKSTVTLTEQIPCNVKLEEGVTYNRITWYKVFESNSLVGLVMKDLRQNTTVLYKNAQHSYKIGENLSLLDVPEPKEEECELYRCSVWPCVGHRILHSDYTHPRDCNTNLHILKSSTQVLASQIHRLDHRKDHNAIVAAVLVLVLMFICIGAFALLYKRRKIFTPSTL